MLNVIILWVVMLNAIILVVVMLSVVVPSKLSKKAIKRNIWLQRLLAFSVALTKRLFGP